MDEPQRHKSLSRVASMGSLRRSKSHRSRTGSLGSQSDAMKKTISEAQEAVAALSNLSKKVSGDPSMDDLTTGLVVVSQVLKQAQHSYAQLDDIVTLCGRLEDTSRALEDYPTLPPDAKRTRRMRRRVDQLARKLLAVGGNLNPRLARNPLMPFVPAKPDTKWLNSLFSRIIAAFDQFLAEAMPVHPEPEPISPTSPPRPQTAELHSDDGHSSQGHGHGHNQVHGHPPGISQGHDRHYHMHKASQSAIVIPPLPSIDETHETSPTTSSEVRAFKVLGAIACAQEPLSDVALAGLLDYPESAMRITLADLHSKFNVPPGASTTVNIIDPKHVSGKLKFHVPGQHQMLFLRCLETMRLLKPDIANIGDASACKDEIPDLREKVARCISPHLSYACRHWSNHLLGSVGGAEVQRVFEALQTFLHRYLLYWLEACSLLGVLEQAVVALGTAKGLCEKLGGQFLELVPLFTDSRWFAFTYFRCVDAAPLQLYQSALALAPAISFISRTHTQAYQPRIAVSRGTLSDWNPCLDRFIAHKPVGVSSIAFSPDGQFFVTSGWDGDLKIWRFFSRTLVRTINNAHGWGICCVTYSPDGKYVVSGGRDHQVKIWEAATGKLARTLEEHTDDVVSLAFSADGTLLLSADGTGVVCLWATTGGRRLLSFRVRSNVFQASLSPDGATIAFCDESSLCIYDTYTGACEYLDFPDIVGGGAAAFSYDGHYIASATEKTIRVGSISQRSLVHYLDIEQRPRQLAFSRDNAYLAWTSQGGSIYLWQVGSEEPPQVISGNLSTGTSIAWCPNADSGSILVAGVGTSVHIWDIALCMRPNVPLEREPSENTLVHSPTARTVVRFRHKEFALISDLPTLSANPDELRSGFTSRPTAPSLSFHTDRAAAWNTSLQSARAANPRKAFHAVTTRCAAVWDWTFLTGQRHQTLDIGFGSPLVTASSDGAFVAYVAPSAPRHSVCVQDLRRGVVVATLPGHADHARVHSMAFSPDSVLLAVGWSDHAVKVWDIETGSLIQSHDAHTRAVGCTAFSSDGWRLVSGSDDSTARVLDLSTGQIVRVFDQREGRSNAPVANVTFTADDAHVITQAGHKSVVSIWNVSTGERIFKLSFEDTTWVYALDFSSNDDGILIHSENKEETVRLPLWRTAARAWPAYNIAKDGWLYAMGPGYSERLGWLPPEWRYLLCADGGRLYVLDCDRWRVVELDLSRLETYDSRLL